MNWTGQAFRGCLMFNDLLESRPEWLLLNPIVVALSKVRHLANISERYRYPKSVSGAVLSPTYLMHDSQSRRPVYHNFSPPADGSVGSDDGRPICNTFSPLFPREQKFSISSLFLKYARINHADNHQTCNNQGRRHKRCQKDCHPRRRELPPDYPILALKISPPPQ